MSSNAVPLSIACAKSTSNERVRHRAASFPKTASRTSYPSLRRMIILDVPSVEGRLMLVDKAGFENIEAAGQTSLEAKMQSLQYSDSLTRNEKQQQRVKQMSADSFSNSWIEKNNAVPFRIDHNYAWSQQPAELKINVQHEGVAEVSASVMEACNTLQIKRTNPSEDSR